MFIQPGDLFQWVYKSSNIPIAEDASIYSHTVNKYVPSGGLCLCIGTTDELFFWICKYGVFHTSKGGAQRGPQRPASWAEGNVQIVIVNKVEL